MAANKTFTIQLNGTSQAITNVTQLKSATQTLEQQLANAQFGSQQAKDLQKQLDLARAKMGQLQKDAGGAGNALQGAFGLGTLAGGQTSAAIGGIQSALTGAVGAAKNLGSAFSSFQSLLVAGPIGLLLLAFGAIVTYLTQTQAGANELKQIMAAFGAVMNVLVGVIAQFGKGLVAALSEPTKTMDSLKTSFNGFVADVKDFVNNVIGKVKTQLSDMFANPKKTLTDLVNAIQNNLITRLKGFAVIYDGIRNADFSKVADGIAQAAVGVTDATSKIKAGFEAAGEAIENVYNKVKNSDVVTQATAAAKASADLEARQQRLLVAERNLSVERAKQALQISQLRFLGEDVTKSNTVRVQALKAANAIEVGGIQKVIALQKEQIAIDQAQLALKQKTGTAQGDDFQKLADDQKKLAELLQQSFDKRKDVNNQIGALNLDAQAKAKAAVEKELADYDAAGTAKLNLQKAQLDRQLAAVRKGSAEELELQKQKVAKENEIALLGIDQKFSKAGPREQELLLDQIDDLNTALVSAQTKLDKDFGKQQTQEAAQQEADKAAARLIGLTQGTREYYQTLLDSQQAEAKLALSKLEDTKENEAARNLILQQSAKDSQDIIDNIALSDPKKLGFGASIFQQLFGVDDNIANEAAKRFQETFNIISQGLDNLQKQQNESRAAAIQAQLDQVKVAQEEIQATIDTAKAAADALKTDLDDSDQRIKDLEDKLATSKGEQRLKLIANLETERAKNNQIAQEKARQDAASKKADDEKIRLQKEQVRLEGEKQEALDKTGTAQKILAQISKGVAAADAVRAGISAVASAAAIPFPANIPAILTAVGTVATAVVAAKSFSDGFFVGGHTGGGGDREAAGVVHKNEYVVPARITRDPQYAGIIGTLEAARLGKPEYFTGGNVGTQTPNVTVNADNSAILDLQRQNVQLRADFLTLAQRPAELVHSEFRGFANTQTVIQAEFTA